MHRYANTKYTTTDAKMIGKQLTNVLKISANIYFKKLVPNSLSDLKTMDSQNI